jgi:transposase
VSERSEISIGKAETAGANPLEALAAKGFAPARPPAEPVSRDPEVVATARRRTFTAAYKQQILRQADACTKPGERGALLRREGLYSSHLTEWRRARDLGGLAGLEPAQRGPKVQPVDPSAVELKQLRRDLARVQAKLERAELVIDIQKKVAALLGIPLQTPDFDGKG